MTTPEDIKHSELLARVNLSGLSFDDMLELSDIISDKAWREKNSIPRFRPSLTPFLCSK